MNNKIKESLVGFTVANFLKQIGFDSDTISGWIKMGGEYHWNNRFFTYAIPQPSKSLVIDWLEENFGIYVESYVDDDKTFGYYISGFVKEGRVGFPLVRGFSSRNEAIERALEWVVENWEKLSELRAVKHSVNE